MSRGIVLFLEVEPDLEEPDAIVEDLEIAAEHNEGITLNVAGRRYPAAVTSVEAEPWTKVTSAQVFGA
jgi:hypothetical protein